MKFANNKEWRYNESHLNRNADHVHFRKRMTMYVRRKLHNYNYVTNLKYILFYFNYYKRIDINILSLRL